MKKQRFIDVFRKVMAKAPSSLDSDLLDAAGAGDLAKCQKLRHAGASLTAARTRGTSTSLQRAAFYGHGPVVRFLLSEGAEIDAQREDDQSTALILAAMQGHAAVVRTLLWYGADANLTDEDEDTALTLCACNGYEGVAIQLLEGGADPTAADADGDTCLIQAAENARAKAVGALLLADAGVSLRLMKNAAGDTALDIAERELTDADDGAARLHAAAHRRGHGTRGHCPTAAGPRC